VALLDKTRSYRLIGSLALSIALAGQAGVPQEASPPRNFVLLFDILNYNRDVGDALTYLYTRVLAPDDQLIIYTPARAYGFSKDTLAKPKRELSEAMKERLRGDTAACGTNYKIIFNDMRNLVSDLEGGGTSGSDALAGVKNSLTMYRQNMENLRGLRKVNETLLGQIVAIFKSQQAKNHMIMLYEAEFRPIPNKDTISRLRAIPEISFIVSELFASDDQRAPLDPGKYIEMFKEVNATFHFLYIKPKDKSSVQDYKEHSADMYDVFSRIAVATGGIVETTASPEAALRAVAKAISGPSK
jgi:hypothetical protein